ncbi:MAG: ABC transporter permease [Alphaproteobacteria bacterium]|nr:ABC transporter permease [Alphaproteobacteria bacterium]MCB9690004.1 ABC transporter permease [Alphaproteobacteria bacterium]
MRLLPALALRNALRSPARTGLTALTIVLGTALLTMSTSWLTGVFEESLSSAAEPVGHVRIADPDYARREALLPLYENIEDTAPILAKLKDVPGVQGAFPRITAPVALSAGEELGEVRGLAVGAPDAWYRERLGLADDLVEGRLPSGPEEVVLGATLAKRLDVALGTEIVVLGQTQDGSMSPLKAKVVGVASGGSGQVDLAAFFPLDRIQWMTDIPDGATEILVYAGDRDRDVALADRLRALDLGEVVVQPWSQRDPWNALLGLISLVRNMLNGTIVFVTALGVWNTMMMSVLERQAEIGVMRAMGLTRFGAVALFVIEALCIAVIGGVVGVSLGAMGSLWLETHGIELGSRVSANLPIAVNTRLYADFTPETALSAFLLGLLMAVLGSAVPAMRAAAIQPVEAIRANR